MVQKCHEIETSDAQNVLIVTINHSKITNQQKLDRQLCHCKQYYVCAYICTSVQMLMSHMVEEVNLIMSNIASICI